MHAPTSIGKFPDRGEVGLTIQSLRFVTFLHIKAVTARQHCVTALERMERDAVVERLTSKTQGFVGAGSVTQRVDNSLARGREPGLVVIELHVRSEQTRNGLHIAGVVGLPKRRVGRSNLGFVLLSRCTASLERNKDR